MGKLKLTPRLVRRPRSAVVVDRYNGSPLSGPTEFKLYKWVGLDQQKQIAGGPYTFRHKRHLNGKFAGYFKDGYYTLPKGNNPGDWSEVQKPILCISGWHACVGEDALTQFFSHRHPYMALFEVEVVGTIKYDSNYGNKIVASQIRLVKRVPLKRMSPFFKKYLSICSPHHFVVTIDGLVKRVKPR